MLRNPMTHDIPRRRVPAASAHCLTGWLIVFWLYSDGCSLAFFVFLHYVFYDVLFSAIVFVQTLWGFWSFWRLKDDNSPQHVVTRLVWLRILCWTMCGEICLHKKSPSKSTSIAFGMVTANKSKKNRKPRSIRKSRFWRSEYFIGRGETIFCDHMLGL